MPTTKWGLTNPAAKGKLNQTRAHLTLQVCKLSSIPEICPSWLELNSIMPPILFMPGKKKQSHENLAGEALIKETCRRIRVARSYWDAHNNSACRRERERALALYERLTKEEREKVPQALRIWLRYRSEKYFGENRTPPKGKSPKPVKGLKQPDPPRWDKMFKGYRPPP
jgi:hypothetical protein